MNMGDLSAMRPAIELLRGTYPSWVRTARSIVGPDEAEDVVQQALVEVLRRYPDFSGLEHPAGYIRVVVVQYFETPRGRADVPTQNLSRNYWKAKAKPTEKSLTSCRSCDNSRRSSEPVFS